MSKSFKRLQAEKVAAEQVLKDMTPLESISETESLRDHFRTQALKAEVNSDTYQNFRSVMLTFSRYPQMKSSA